jgi:hypothetical protein
MPTATARRARWIPGLLGALTVVACALAAPLQAQTGGTGARASAPAVPTSLGVGVVRTSQSAILNTGRLKVRVQSGEAGRISVVGRGGPLRPGSRAARITRRAAVELAAPGSAELTLRLTRAGRAVLSGCAPRSLIAAATLVRPGVAGRDRGFGSSAMRVDRAGCGGSSVPAPGGGSPGAGSADGGTAGGPIDGGGGGEDGNVVPPPTPYAGELPDTSNASRCDWIDTPSGSGGADPVCLQPFPNDFFTVADPDSDTGRRVSLNLQSMPANRAGIHINPSEINRNDGFSPGNMIIVRVPGLDSPQAFENTGAVGVDDMASYADPGQPVVVIDADSGERQPIWSEIDYNPLDPAKGGDASNPADRADVNLIIRPARNFEEGHRYIVALRKLKDEHGQTIEPTDAFRIYRDNLTTSDPVIEDRRPHMEDLFAKLGDAHIGRSSLYLTWDFTVASERNLSERMLSIRDDAFSTLGDTDLADGIVEGSAPGAAITSTTDYAYCDSDGAPECADPNPLTGAGGEDNEIARIVKGTVSVPCYMDTPGCLPLGSTFNYGTDTGPDRLPERIPGNTAAVGFECIVPHSALDAPGGHSPARVSLYGHGLLGSAGEVEGGNVQAMAAEHNIIFCATDWYGFATVNVPNILLILQDVSVFPLLADETQQGMLNFLFLGRLALHDQGLRDDGAFEDAQGQSIVNNDRLLYDGNSQGGILGGSLTAFAPDFRRAVLGVPGMNYSTLLQRSVDFEPFGEGKFLGEVCGELPDPLPAQCSGSPLEDSPLGLYDNYPDELERPLIFSLMQMLWDRGEADGYAHHITDDPFPDTPSHEVLMHAAFGDHQVANVAAEVEARTIGARIYAPSFEPGRYWDPNGVFGIDPIPGFPYGGSALVYWDGGPVGAPGGTAPPPNEDIPPRPTSGCGQAGPPGCGADPHSYPRNDVKARAQKSDFLQLDRLNNYCTTANRPDPAPSLLVPNSGAAIPCHSHGWLGS